MDIGDLIFRAALVSAVMILAGVFAYNIGIDEDRSYETVPVIAESLSKLFHSTLSWDEGSYARIIFNSDEAGINTFTGEIEGESYDIRILPGSIHIEFKGSMYTIMETPAVTPCRPADGPGLLNRSVSREISRAFGGFTIRTPCTLSLEVSDVPEGKTLFIWPDTEENHLDDIDSLNELFEDSGQVIDGWERQVRFRSEDVVVQGHIILFMDDASEEIIGVVGKPYLLPSSTDLSALIDTDPYKYVVRKYAKEQDDGTYLIETSIHTA